MSTYELDDGLVQRFIKDASNMDWMPAAELGEELERQVPSPLPTNLGAERHKCTHNPAVQLDPPEYFDHFMHCLSPEAQQGQLEEWRKAAHRWWGQQTREAMRPEDKVEAPERHLPIDVEPQDMCVHVVLPGGAVLTLANSEPPTPQALEPFGERDKRIMRTLLLAASDELVGPYNYGYSYGVQQPMPAAFPVAPRPVKP